MNLHISLPLRLDCLRITMYAPPRLLLKNSINTLLPSPSSLCPPPLLMFNSSSSQHQAGGFLLHFLIFHVAASSWARLPQPRGDRPVTGRGALGVPGRLGSAGTGLWGRGQGCEGQQAAGSASLPARACHPRWDLVPPSMGPQAWRSSREGTQGVPPPPRRKGCRWHRLGLCPVRMSSWGAGPCGPQTGTASRWAGGGRPGWRLSRGPAGGGGEGRPCLDERRCIASGNADGGSSG